MANKKLKTVKLDKLIDKHVGKKGTESRDQFEEELRLDIIGHKIKELRKSRNMTQEQLGELVGVKKSQISKIENSFADARIETILKVFRALNTKIKFSIVPAVSN